MIERVEVVKRESIPSGVSGIIEQWPKGAEVRDFRACAELRDFLRQRSKLSVSWVVLGKRQVVAANTHPAETLIVIHSGAGHASGALECRLEPGDVLVIPAGCEQGFASGSEGLQALRIQLAEPADDASDPAEGLVTALPEATAGQRSLDALLAFNDERLLEFKQGGLFQILAGGGLGSTSKRAACRSALRVWIDAYASLLLTRQAVCANERFSRAFQRQLLSGLGVVVGATPQHKGSGRTIAEDARLTALAGWFGYQMHLLDDIEKAAITELVVHAANRALLGATRFALEDDGDSQLWEALGMSAPRGAPDLELLCEQSSPGYSRLLEITKEAWEMMAALADRIAALTRSA